MPTKSQKGRSRTARTNRPASAARTPVRANTPAKSTTTKAKAPKTTKAAARQTATVSNPRNRVRMWQNAGPARSRASRVDSIEASRRIEAAYRNRGMDAAGQERENIDRQNRRADAYQKFRNNQTWGDSGIRRSTIKNRIAKAGKKNGTITIKKGGKNYTIRYWTGKNGSLSTSPA